MFWTRFFIPTVKETPHDATVPSHVLMIRAGMLRQTVAGAYSYLPLGYRTLQKVTSIIREEMNAAGAIELNMPAMHPIELWQETGRVEAMGPVLIHLPDQPWRRGTVLGPTHEEIVTDIVRSYINSYKQLPINLYQIQTKFRDEARPKSGVLRTREFLMKDAYSFDVDKDGLDVSYQKMYDAYCRIFTRCGLPYVAVEADSGPIGGDASHEFMVVTDAGEDYLARAADGSYAANLERAVALEPRTSARADARDADAPAEPTETHTPGLSTIEQVSRFLKCDPSDMIKTIIFQHPSPGASPPALEPRTSVRADARAEAPTDGLLVALVRGDHEVNEAKLARVAGVTRLEPATPQQIEALTGADVGFAGPVGLDARIIADQAVAAMHNAVTGANKTDYHVTGVNPGRDFEITESADIRYAVDGDIAPGGAPLIFEKCIEVGHVFKLGTKYSDAMRATFLDKNGSATSFVMGCYGIGANRIVAAAIESHHDDNGICWPITIAPFTVHICALDVRDQDVIATARRLHDQLEAGGIDTLLDDRDARPGHKFKDADLIGIPIRLTVGKRGLDAGIVELKFRSDADVQKVPPDDALDRVRLCIARMQPTSPPGDARTRA